MKAFVMKQLDSVGFMEKPMPKPGPDEAIVKTTKALICTSDSHTVHGAIGPRENLTLGHEAVGVVHEVGAMSSYSSRGIGSWWELLHRTGLILPRRRGILRSRERRWEGGNFPTRKMAYLPSFSR